MKRFTTRFAFEVSEVPGEDPLEAASKVLREVSVRLSGKRAREGVWRLFLGRAEIGRVFELKDRDPG
ncbi:MAG: hypothetical protein GXO17_01525 [Thermodesulfobacteria bacterium]|nr:hypothetical protein [Thermodesulfobacteriota bacterium]